MPKQFYLGGNWVSSNDSISILNPYNSDLVENVFLASRENVCEAIDIANRVFEDTKKLAVYERVNILNQLIEGIEKRFDELVNAIVLESGKPKVYAKGEVQRAIETCKAGIQAVQELKGEVISLDWTSKGFGKKGQVNYFPIGVVAGIAPFNFPLNLVMHKLVPVIASGCAMVLKPASKTPLTSIILAEIVDQTDWVKGAFSVLPCNREVGNELVLNEKVKLLSFTGSPDVGWEMKSQVRKKKVVLELGGNACAIVAKSADLDLAMEKLLVGAFAYSGQVCIHTQRIVVHESLFDEFLNRFIEKTKMLKIGNPMDESTKIASMISEKESNRVLSWVEEAINSGAECLLGGTKKDGIVLPTVLTNTNKLMRVVSKEVFGPVVCIEKFCEFEEAIHYVNDTDFGLQASLFTNNHSEVKLAYKELEVGGVIINDSTTFRVDQMPYGGIKDSGLGREGVTYAMQDMMEMKLLVD